MLLRQAAPSNRSTSSAGARVASEDSWDRPEMETEKPKQATRRRSRDAAEYGEGVRA